MEHLQEQQIVAGLGYDIENMRSEIRLFSTETGKELGVYEEEFWDLAICAINGQFLVASDGEGRYTTWNWKTGAKVSQFKVPDEVSFFFFFFFALMHSLSLLLTVILFIIRPRSQKHCTWFRTRSWNYITMA